MSAFIKSPNKSLTEALTRTDLVHYISETISDFNEDIDKEIFTNALNLNQMKVRDCMVPRPEVISFDQEDSLEELRELFIESKLSRVLITDGDIEHVSGYIHHQQLLDNPKRLKRLILEMPLEFINENHNIACVVDEFGSTAGIITLEDILEEIFGEIEDEHDIEELIERQISDDEYLLSGRLEIDHINETFEALDLPEGEYHTLSGYIVMTSGKIPEEEGEIIEQDGFEFTIEKLSDTKIEVIRVKLLPEEEED